MDIYIGIGIVVVVLWGWIVWEIITTPTSDPGDPNEPTDIDKKYEDWWPDRDKQ